MGWVWTGLGWEGGVTTLSSRHNLLVALHRSVVVIPSNGTASSSSTAPLHPRRCNAVIGAGHITHLSRASGGIEPSARCSE